MVRLAFWEVHSCPSMDRARVSVAVATHKREGSKVH